MKTPYLTTPAPLLPIMAQIVRLGSGTKDKPLKIIKRGKVLIALPHGYLEKQKEKRRATRP